MQVRPYLYFNGRCEEAIDFYKKALAAEVIMLLRFKDSADAPPLAMLPGATEDKIMHVCFRVGATELMASDGDCEGETSFQGFSLSISPANDAEAERLFNALADGGEVQMALEKTFWASSFGLVTDRFGLCWMVSVAEDAVSN